jgi:hypothetical protein
MTEWENAFNKEIETALIARQSGKEGKARVCARRAANIVIKAYLQQQNIPHSSNSLRNFRILRDNLDNQHSLLLLIDHLSLRVDNDFSLPEGVDLIQDALTLKSLLISHH